MQSGKRLLEGASAVIATSSQEAEELVAGGVPARAWCCGGTAWKCLHCGRNGARSGKAQRISNDVKLVLFLGRLSVKKSPALLLRAFGELSKRLAGIPLQLVFAGPDEGGVEAELDQTATQLGVRSKVQFVGPIFGETKWAAYRDADVFVLSLPE